MEGTGNFGVLQCVVKGNQQLKSPSEEKYSYSFTKSSIHLLYRHKCHLNKKVLKRLNFARSKPAEFSLVITFIRIIS